LKPASPYSITITTFGYATSRTITLMFSTLDNNGGKFY
jgi:hypothetical protein